MGTGRGREIAFLEKPDIPFMHAVFSRDVGGGDLSELRTAVDLRAGQLAAGFQVNATNLI